MLRQVPMTTPVTMGQQAMRKKQRHHHKGTTHGYGDTVVGVATEDAHEEHQGIEVAEVLGADTLELPHEEGHHALRGQFGQSHLITLEEALTPRTEEEHEESRDNHSEHRAVGLGQARHKPHEECEEQSQGRVDEHGFPDITTRHRHKVEQEEHGTEDRKIGRGQTYGKCDWHSHYDYKSTSLCAK